MGRTDYIYFVIDVSNSMQGAKLGSVNDAINNIVHRLKKVMNNMNIEIKLVVMTFAEDIKWSSILPISLSSFVYEDLSAEASESQLGRALNELNEKLLKQEVVQDSTGETTLILFSDGLATDDYEEQMRKLECNRVFLNANRIVFTYESAIYALIKAPLCAFAGREENIIIDDFLSLNRMLFERYR